MVVAAFSPLHGQPHGTIMRDDESCQVAAAEAKRAERHDNKDLQ